MKLIDFVINHIKRLLSDWKSALFVLVLPAGMLAFTLLPYLLGSDANLGPVQTVNLDGAGLGVELLDNIPLNQSISTLTVDEEIQRLKDFETEFLVVIPQDYTEKIQMGDIPTLLYYSRDESAVHLQMMQLIDQASQELIKNETMNHIGIPWGDANNTISVTHVAEDNELDSAMLLLLLMSSYFIIIFSCNAGAELIDMKEKKITHRVLVSPNRGFEILLGMAIANFLITFVPYVFSLYVLPQLFGMDTPPLYVIVLVIACMSFFSIALSLFVARIFKRKEMATFFPTIYGLVGFFSTQLVMMENENPVWNIISYVTPLRYIAELLFHGDYLQNALIILAMTFFLLLAGGTNLQRFAED